MPQAHRRKIKHLHRTSEHSRAMLRNIAINLIRHERIKTTVNKAKQARRLAEKIITLGKKGTLHARRRALSLLHSKPAVSKVFNVLALRFEARAGGYTRIVRLPETIRLPQSDPGHNVAKRYQGTRLGDGSSVVLLEFVEAEIKEKKRRKKPRAAPEEPPAAPEQPAPEETPSDSPEPQ